MAQSHKENQYLSSVEWLRFLAAFGIVWFHTEKAPWKSVGYAGLPVFLLVFCALIVIHFNEINFADFLKKRSYRLLLPWIFWSAVFLVIKVGRCYLSDERSLTAPSWNEYLVGGNIHLWFLPFAFLLSLVLYWACKYSFKSSGHNLRVVVASLVVLIGSLYVTAYLAKYVPLNPPFTQWLFAIPCLPLGFCLGYIFRTISSNCRYILYSIIFVVVLLVCMHLCSFLDNTLLVPYGIGLFLTIAALIVPIPYEKSARFLGSLTYGIYLIHPLVMFAVNRTPFLHGFFLSILATFSVSAVIVYYLRKTRLRIVL